MAILSADHHFSIGHEHVISGKPCQDHALSAFDGSMACAVISDGCSTGGETDMGARVLTFASAAAIKAYHSRHKGVMRPPDPNEYGVVTEVGAQQRIVLGTVRQALGLARDDMLATCGYAFVTNEGGVMHLAGDGVMAMKSREGMIAMSQFDWGKVPFYPQYREEADGIGYIREHGGDPKTIALTEGQWVYTPQNKDKFLHVGDVAWTVEDGMRGITRLLTKEAINDQLAAVAVFTDGVLRVDGVDWKDVVVALMKFKTTEGLFVKRRLNRALKDFRAHGKGPMDDIAYAVIHVEPEQRTEQGEANGNPDQNTQGTT
ncbi:MAG: protein phosphatase 2C domain-containing protein [bacterium]|nr:protein phosphatase 2C domain-containing protein [bacterium]